MLRSDIVISATISQFIRSRACDNDNQVSTARYCKVLCYQTDNERYEDPRLIAYQP